MCQSLSRNEYPHTCNFVSGTLPYALHTGKPLSAVEKLNICVAHPVGVVIGLAEGTNDGELDGAMDGTDDGELDG